MRSNYTPMPHNAADVVASTSHHPDKNRNLTERVGSASRRIHMTSSGEQHVGSNGKRKRSKDAERRDFASPRRSVLGKRNRLQGFADGHESCYPPAKRHCRPPLSPPTDQLLCDDCAEICWDGIEKIVKEKLRFTWKGRPVADVGRRYRKLSPDNTCTLCRQLHAPWIEKFLENQRWIEGKVIPDIGDRIHVFPNLQYIHHISNFQSGRNVLRAHDAPYHIAVVPIAPRWKEGLLQHMATRGMVVVLPDGRPESKILQPQQIPQEFDPKPVRSWLKTCRRHRSRCNPKPPEVKGLRVIDCKSEHLTIRDHQPGDEYVGLSYVWGSSSASGSTGPTDANAQGLMDTKKRILRLPRNVPLTIRDAIEVTKALRYRYLWVDKYCIDQYNENEKREQFSRMGDIYAGSQVAIFALGDDSEAGLPGVTTPRLGQQECRSCRYRFISTMPDPHEFIKWSKWSTRAWTYQEGLFSTRRLFFTNHQVYFECNAMNCAESFKSDLDIIHTNNGQRFRAYHRAGQFVCGNSSNYSHLDVRRNQANHRKVDMLRRCQHQITQYTKRELTNKDDVLHAFAAIARFYAKTTAMIASLAGIPIPFPIANLPASRKQEGLDHLSYALAWSHEVDNFDGRFPRRYFPPNNNTKPAAVVGNQSKKPRLSQQQQQQQQQQQPWTPNLNPKPQRRHGFPSWSWAGWFGQVRNTRDHLPYCWTSLLSCVQIGFPDGGDHVKDYDYIQGFERYKAYFIRELLTADTLHFEAYMLSTRELASRIAGSFSYSNDGGGCSAGNNGTNSVEVRLSTGPTSLEEFQTRLLERYYQCVVLGTYGQPRRDVYRAIQVQDTKRATARKRRIELFERSESDAIVCLVVRTDPVTGVSYRKGLLRVRYYTGRGGDDALRGWHVGEKIRFILK